jgi:putative SOS response-associated peptidase YedK
MCGRYRLSRQKLAIEEYFAAEPIDLEWEPRYNIAPSQSVPTIRRQSEDATLRLSLMRWGLIPSWSQGLSPRVGMIAAAGKPAFRDALKARRCLIPADGFYEWQRISKGKQLFCFEVGEGEVFAFAGLWDLWKSANRRTGGKLFDSDYHSELPDHRHSQPYAGDPLQGRLRSVVRSEDEKPDGDQRTLEAV